MPTLYGRNRFDFFDKLRGQFNRSPLQRDGNMYTRRMARPENPGGIPGIGYVTQPRGVSGYQPSRENPWMMSRTPGQQATQPGQASPRSSRPLESSFVLPEGATTDMAYRQRQTPQSEGMRAAGFQAGVNIENQNLAEVSPSYFSRSQLQVPYTEDQWGNRTPIFGSVIDYTTGRFYNPTNYPLPAYGRFQGRPAFRRG